MSKLAIIGSNDLGRIIAHHAISANWEVVGFFDNLKAVGTQIEDFGSVIGNTDEVENLYSKKVFDYIIIGVGYTRFEYRKEVFDRFKGKIPFANIIHRSSYVDNSVSLGEGIIILPGCVLDMKVKIEDNVLLNTGCKIAHDSKIGKHSFVAPGVVIAGNVEVNECCFLGVGSVIIDSVTVIAKTMLGGGSLVITDILIPGTYVGSPVRRLKDNIYFS